MFRKLLLPLAATALLAGCVTAPYEYRGDREGGYYYGAPSVEYRYRYGGPGYDPYYGPYPYRSGISIWGTYGYPYYGPYGYPRYGNPYYGNPYYGNPYYGGYPHRHPAPRPPSNATPRPDGGPWRNIDEIVRRRRAVEGGGGLPPAPDASGPRAPTVMAPPPPPPRPVAPRSDDGSAFGDAIRRVRKPGTRED